MSAKTSGSYLLIAGLEMGHCDILNSRILKKVENNGNLALNNGQLKGLLLKFHSQLFCPLCETFLHLSPEKP